MKPLTVEQTAERLTVDAEIIYAAIKSGKLEAANLGRGKIPRWRITEDQIADYLDRCTRSNRKEAVRTRPRVKSIL